MGPGPDRCRKNEDEPGRHRQTKKGSGVSDEQCQEHMGRSNRTPQRVGGVKPRTRRAKGTSRQSPMETSRPPPQRRKRQRDPDTPAEQRTRKAHEESKRRKRVIEDQAAERTSASLAKALQTAVNNAELGPNPDQKASLALQILKETLILNRAHIREPIAKDRATAGTAPLNLHQDAGPTPGQQPMENPQVLTHVWTPRNGTKVNAWWADANGKAKLAGQKGDWHSGEITEQTWPADQGAPIVTIYYPGWGECDHTALHMGSQITPLQKGKTPRKGQPPLATTLSPQALQWIGRGAEIEVKRGKKWYRGIVEGMNRNKLVVKHPKIMRNRKTASTPRAIKGKNEVVEYPDIETRGCRVVTMK